MTNTETLPSVVQGAHGMWAVYVDGKRVSRFFSTRHDAIFLGIPAEYKWDGKAEYTPREPDRFHAAHQRR